MGGRKGEGWEGAQTSIQLHLEQEKPPKVPTLSPHHTTRPRRRLANDGNSSRSWPAQLVPSIGAILLTVHDITGLAKCPPEKQTRSHWTVETLCIDSY